MPDIMRAYQVRASDDAGNPGDPIRFVASTSDVARDGMIVEASGWVLDNFRKNPVFLWAHGYWEPAIGKVISVDVQDDQLIADVVFDQDDEFARKIESKYRSGILNAVSVGFDIKEFAPAAGDNPIPRATKAELLELSGVPVPADPGALASRRGVALRSLGQELLKLADDAETDGQPPAGEPAPTGTTPGTAPPVTTEPPDDVTVRLSWDATAAAMVDLYRPYSQRPDDERKAEHERLARAYARHKKTAPDFRTSAELEAYDADTLRGLFLEGEPDLFPDRFAAMVSRAGAVLSRRNRDDLQQAITLLQGVLERAQTEADEAAHDDEQRAAEAALRKLLDKLPAKG